MRAEELRTIAGDMREAETRIMILRVAEGYDLIAERMARGTIANPLPRSS
jgi:hypothetical protein